MKPFPQTKLALLLVLHCWITPVATHAAGLENGKRPNVLFIAIDDFRPELGCYGNTLVKSPHIDRIAKSGMVFGRAYCQQAVCSPSRTSMLTGLRPDTTKVWDLSTHFRKAQPDIVTLPQHFKNNGYIAQSIGKIYHSTLDDKASWSVPSTNPRSPHGSERKPGQGRGHAYEVFDGPENQMFDGELTEMAVAALGELKEKDQPFFLGVGYIKPHLPFIAPRKYWDLYDPAEIPLASNPFPQKGAPDFAVRGKGELHGYGGVPNQRVLPDELARKLKHGYLACTSFIDAQVGVLMAELERLGMVENTIIVIWGDHGFKLGEHAAWAKHSNVELDTRAPLIVSVPEMPNAGKATNALVEFVDIYPSLAELAGLPKPAKTEGVSFAPLMEKPDRPWKTAAFSQFPRGKAVMGYSMRTPRYRLTHWINKNKPTEPVAVELYDLENDPQENTNIAGKASNKELVDKLTAEWRAGWKAAIPKQP